MAINYSHTEIPDYHIRIGIKDGEVVEMDWAEMFKHEKAFRSKEETVKRVTLYLTQAKKRIKIKK